MILMSLCIIPDTDMQPILSPALALFAGIVVANTMGNPFEKLSREAVKTLLKIAIVGLGFGIHADKAMQAGGKPRNSWQSSFSWRRLRFPTRRP